MLGLGLSGLIVAPSYAKKQAAPAAEANSGDPVVARVNGDPIYRSDVQAVLQQIIPAGKQPSPEDLQKLYPRLIDDLISRKLAFQEAMREKLQDKPEVHHAIMNAEQQVLVQAFFGEVGKPAVTEENMKKAYDEAVKVTPPQDEVHARHILVKTEDEAKDIIKQLDGGADFAKLAKEKSTDKGNAQDGGDLGYFTKGSMDPAFSDAAFALQPGTYTKTPVKTSFGYHVIQVLDKRPAKMPTFDEAKPQLESQLAQRAIQVKLKSIAEKSKIEVFNPDGSPITPQPAAAAPVAAPVAQPSGK
jgi:peptidyl-prolyl cis-trans isomerase C